MLKKILAVLMSVCLVCGLCPESAMAQKLNRAQIRRLNVIVNTCIANYDESGVLPSICLAQALQETNLGKAYNNNNLWGICSNGYAGYSSLEEGTLAYLSVINNGHYDKALFETDYKKAIRAILDGGYCQPEGSYYSDVLWLYDYYDLGRYDQKLFKAQAQKQKKANQKGYFVVRYNKDIPDHCCRISSKVAEKGTVQLWKNKELQGIWDVQKSDDVKVGVIELNYPELNTKRVHIKAQEGAKG